MLDGDLCDDPDALGRPVGVVVRGTEPDGAAGHVRGVDVLRFRDGLVAEKLSYVKG